MASDAAGNCVRVVCDADGNGVEESDPADPPADDGQQCTTEGCSGPNPVHTAKANKTPCGSGGFCNPFGTCVDTGFVPAGSFPMGRSTSGADAFSAGAADETPEHTATVDKLNLDTFEVTVGRFRAFVDAYPSSKPADGVGAHPKIAGTGWQSGWNGKLPADQNAIRAALNCDASLATWTDSAQKNENKPINCVSWFEAFAFCAWDGARLPTEVEWEKAAAGGTENRLYPWGAAAPTTAKAAFGCGFDGNTSGCSAADIPNVGSVSSGKGWWGHQDLAGSVWEWTFDGYDGAWYSGAGASCSDCANASETSRVVRGGGWSTGTATLRAARRNSDAPSTRNNAFGFRCVRDP